MPANRRAGSYPTLTAAGQMGSQGRPLGVTPSPGRPPGEAALDPRRGVADGPVEVGPACRRGTACRPSAPVGSDRSRSWGRRACRAPRSRSARWPSGPRCSRSSDHSQRRGARAASARSRGRRRRAGRRSRGPARCRPRTGRAAGANGPPPPGSKAVNSTTVAPVAASRPIASSYTSPSASTSSAGAAGRCRRRRCVTRSGSRASAGSSCSARIGAQRAAADGEVGVAEVVGPRRRAPRRPGRPSRARRWAARGRGRRRPR